MNERDRIPLTEEDRKTMIIHGLLCPPLTYAEAFAVLGSMDYAVRAEAAKRLSNLGLLNGETLTPRGWDTLRKLLDSAVLEKVSHIWRQQMKDLFDRYESERLQWSILKSYVGQPFKPPEPADVTIDAPRDVASICGEYLRHSRLCVCVGAWAGAIAYCSLALEHVLLSVLVARGIRKGFTDVPALQELNGEVGRHVPEVSTLSQRIVPIIANFRNDSVHPRDHRLRPGENQARNVYELTVRFMADVNASWFKAV